MAENEKSEVPGMLENWGFHTKTARPGSVSSHDQAEQENPGEAGINPTEGYKPGAGDNVGSAGPKSVSPESVGPAPVIPATHIDPGPERDAPPMTGALED